jgi:hypothetical protein
MKTSKKTILSRSKTYLLVVALLLVGSQVLGATTIQTNLTNALQVIQRILITSDGALDGDVIMAINTGTDNNVLVNTNLNVNGTGSFSGKV